MEREREREVKMGKITQVNLVQELYKVNVLNHFYLVCTKARILPLHALGVSRKNCLLFFSFYGSV